MSSDINFDTHEVFNQPPAFENVNLFASDDALQAAVKREGGTAALPELVAYGALAGSADMLHAGRVANENPPKLRSFSPRGERLDRVEFHPAYHQLMRASCEAGMHCMSWENTPGVNVARAAIVYMGYQMEPGHTCPQVMTNACIAALRHAPALEERLRPQIMNRAYDGADKPISEKEAITIGMGMTEKQGGSDVRANTTQAEPIGSDGEYRIVGHKWFFSAPMCDAFLILAQAPAGLSCFFLPRYLPDGSRNQIRLMRLKEKLGNHANASSEAEFAGAHGWLVGEEGRGVRTIIEMVSYTRVDCAVASAGLMRWGLANALHHTSYRTAFQKKLIDQPLMRNVLADLTLDSEAATALTFRLARCFDNKDDEFSRAFMRLMTPAIKYWVCKAAPHFTYEAMECLGGGGFVEEGPMAWAFREAPLNAIWEGSGNVMCLDVARAASRHPEAVEMIFGWLSETESSSIRSGLENLSKRLKHMSNNESELRVFVERLVHLVASAILQETDRHAVADGYASSRLNGTYRTTYGQLAGVDVDGILQSAR